MSRCDLLVSEPIYAVDIDPSLLVRGSEKMPREDWINANARLIDDVCAEQWLPPYWRATTPKERTAPRSASGARRGGAIATAG